MRRTILLALLVASVTGIGLAASRTKARVHYEKALHELRGKNFGKASKEFRKAVKEDPTWADAHFQLGMAYLALGKFKDAEKSNQAALELDPSLPDVQYWAEFYVDRRQLAKVIRLAEQGNFESAAEPLRNFLQEDGDVARFREVFRNSFLNPFPVLHALLWHLADRKDLDRVEGIVSEWSELSPQDSGPLFYVAFKAMVNAQQTNRALDWADLWMDRVPEAAVDVLANRGLLLVDLGRKDEAQAAYDRLVVLSRTPNLISEGPELRTFVTLFGGSFQECELPYRTTPQYTRSAIANRITGSLTFRGVVELDGRLHEAQLASRRLGYGLDENAEAALAEWRFVPARLNDIPIRRRALVEVSFNLN